MLSESNRHDIENTKEFGAGDVSEVIFRRLQLTQTKIFRGLAGIDRIPRHSPKNVRGRVDKGRACPQGLRRVGEIPLQNCPAG